MLYWTFDSEHKQSYEEPCPSPEKVLPSKWYHKWSSKDHSIVPSSHVLWDVVEHGKINEFHISMGSLQHFLCCEVP